MTDGLKAPLSMILVQILTTVMLLLSKVVLNRGIFVFALLAYCNVIGAGFVAPFAFFLKRDMWKNLGWKGIMWIFINGLFGVISALSLYYYGLRDTTAAFASNFLNLIPVVTFFFAVVAGMEKLGLCSSGGRVKVFGTLLCVGGAMVVSLYKGKVLHIWPSYLIMHHDLAKQAKGVHNWLCGTLLLLTSCTSYACWFIVQVKLYKVFPSKFWTTMLTCMAGCIQTMVLGIILCRDNDAWRLKWDLQLLMIVYTGVFNTGATFCLVSWVVAKKGPIYPSMFNSISVIFTTILESLFMGQDITIGSLIGMFMIIGGLYAFSMGQRKGTTKGRNEGWRHRIGTTSVPVSKDIIVHKDAFSVYVDPQNQSYDLSLKESEGRKNKDHNVNENV